MNQDYFNPIRNPMTIIALFVGLTELAFGLSMRGMSPNLQPPVVWFIVLFPCVCALLFFVTLFFRPKNFYGPVHRKMISIATLLLLSN